jgi:RND family efflux transporter MFP subunit
MKLSAPSSSFSALARGQYFWLKLVAVLALAGMGGFVALKNSEVKASETGKAASPAAPLEFAPADIAVVRLQSLARTVSISGSLAPVTQALVKSTVSGEVRRVAVREGESVRQGAVVAEMDTTDSRSRLNAALADQAERRSRLEIAVRNRDTNQTLLKQNFISQNAYDQLQSTYQGSEAAVQWADAQVQLARKAMGDAVVRAPIAGQVARRWVNGGERLGPDAPIVTLVDLSRMELEATVPASDLASISVGQFARFQVDGFGERRFEGKVERINPVAEASSRAIKLFVSVPNADGSLRGGMFAQGAVTLSQSAAAPVIPAGAVFEEAGQSYVFTIEDGKLAKRAVRLGLKDEASGLVEAASGLTAGTPVVRIRMNGLKVGSPAILGKGGTAPTAAPPA